MALEGGRGFVSALLLQRRERRRDLDNQNKLGLDALPGVVYSDDSQVSKLILTRD